jgi:hypothetical protein
MTYVADTKNEWDPDEALDRWEKLTEEETREKRLKEIAGVKAALSYSDALAQEICERIAVGELLINICNDSHLPSSRACNRWMREHSEFAQLYQSAINDRLKVFEEEVLKIADDMKNDFRTVIKNGVEKRVPDPEMVARAKLRIDVRFKHLKAGMPSKWGEMSTVNLRNADDDTSNLSPEQLEKEIADIEQKSRMSRAA